MKPVKIVFDLQTGLTSEIELSDNEYSDWLAEQQDLIDAGNNDTETL